MPQRLTNKFAAVQAQGRPALVTFIMSGDPDQVTADVYDGSTQRVLSEKGWHEAVHIGNAIRFYKIPFDEVYTSQ